MNFAKLFDAIKGPALTAASTLIPGGPAILAAVNAFMPADKKLPPEATGQEIVTAVQNLPPDQQAELMKMELQVEIEEIQSWQKIQESLAQADAAGASTRPKIAMMMAYCVVIVVYLFIGAWVWAMFNVDKDALAVIKDSWPMMVAVIGTPTALLRAYFGMRTKEKQSRYSAASGQDLAGGLAGIIRAFKK